MRDTDCLNEIWATENTYQDTNQISSMGQATKVTGRLTSLHNACGDGQPVGRL
jgi:hypothetical protein